MGELQCDYCKRLSSERDYGDACSFCNRGWFGYPPPQEPKIMGEEVEEFGELLDLASDPIMKMTAPEIVAEVRRLRASLTRAEAEREEAVNECDRRFDAGYQMAIEHSIRVCALVNEGLAGADENRESKRLINAIIARLGLRAPDPTRLSRASGAQDEPPTRAET